MTGPLLPLLLAALGTPGTLLGCHGRTSSTTGDQCVSCHVGIEPAHDENIIASDNCTLCHGGDGEALEKQDAHVAVPDDYWEIRGEGLPDAPDGFIKDMAPDQLDQLDPDYVRFINPGDIRVADQTCGECHSYPVDLVEAVRNSVMTTNSGHYMPTRFLAGFQDRDAVYGSYSAEDPHYDGAAGTVPSLEPLRPAEEDEIMSVLEDGDTEGLREIAIDHYLAKSCNTCHAAGYPRNDSRHLYRSTGCSGCHSIYNADGVYEGGDEALPKNVPVYASSHRITTAIPTEQCATCHFQGGRIGLLFRGIREGGFSEVPEHAEPWAESAYGHAAGYYFLDEDTTNDFDETPPDLHYAAGMHCADCHVGTDVHGDGRIYTTDKFQVDLRCEDCHGTPRQRIVPSADGAYYTSGGRKLSQLSTDSDGNVVLTGIVDGEEHIVPQPADILASDQASDAMRTAMEPDAQDWCHPDSLTCDTCHNSYQQFCVGCHVSYDMRFTQVDYQTGHPTTGLVRGSRDTWTLDHILLGQAPDGRAQSTNPSQQVQLTVIDFDGELWTGQSVLDDSGVETDEVLGEFRSVDLTDTNIGFSPFFQHTTSATPRSCDSCHRSDSSDDELQRVRGVYGHGTGEFMLDNPDGDPVDALKFLDDEGNAITTWVHEGTGPLSPEVRQRALDVVLEELE